MPCIKYTKHKHSYIPTGGKEPKLTPEVIAFHHKYGKFIKIRGKWEETKDHIPYLKSLGY